MKQRYYLDVLATINPYLKNYRVFLISGSISEMKLSMYNCFVNTQVYRSVNYLCANYTPELAFFTTYRRKVGMGIVHYMLIIFGGLLFIDVQ